VVVRTVAPGDTLLGLARDVYGLSAKAREMSRLVDLLRQINPQLKNADLILPGQQITFPDARKARPGIDPDGGRREKEMGEHALQKDGRG
jgi:nucleoid-associated protein YgaU